MTRTTPESLNHMECSVEKTGLDYEGNIIRPPSEAFSIILQATVGCSHNKCTFCGTYTGQRFKIKDEQTILSDLAFAAKYMKRQDRLFICDGDGLIMPQKKLVRLLEKIREMLPWVRRVGLYGNTKSIKMKTDEQLKELKDLGLGILYMGVESGDDRILKEICKGTTAANLMSSRASGSWPRGSRLSVTVLLGLGGTERSLEHARATGRLLTEMDPDYVGALTLMLIPGTPLGDAYERGRVQPGPCPIRPNYSAELREMVAATDLSRGLFFANHASNYLPVKIRYPPGQGPGPGPDRPGPGGAGVGLKPEWMRAL